MRLFRFFGCLGVKSMVGKKHELSEANLAAHNASDSLVNNDELAMPAGDHKRVGFHVEDGCSHDSSSIQSFEFTG